MTWLNLILLVVALVLPTTGGAAPCTPNLPEQLIPQAGVKGTAMWPREVIKQEYRSAEWMTDKGFDHVVGMLNAVTVYPCERSQPATVEIQRMELVRFKPEGGFVTEASFRFDGESTIKLDGAQFKRYPEWFVSGKPVLQKPVLRLTGGVLSINLKPIPESIVHMWTDPRVKAAPGARYGIIAVVKVEGDARLQFGMDYWRGGLDYNGWSEGCVTSNNCEAWLSDWIGDTKGQYQTVLVPRAFGRSQ